MGLSQKNHLRSPHMTAQSMKSAHQNPSWLKKFFEQSLRTWREILAVDVKWCSSDLFHNLSCSYLSHLNPASISLVKFSWNAISSREKHGERQVCLRWLSLTNRDILPNASHQPRTGRDNPVPEFVENHNSQKFSWNLYEGNFSVLFLMLVTSWAHFCKSLAESIPINLLNFCKKPCSNYS